MLIDWFSRCSLSLAPRGSIELLADALLERHQIHPITFQVVSEEASPLQMFSTGSLQDEHAKQIKLIFFCVSWQITWRLQRDPVGVRSHSCLLHNVTPSSSIIFFCTPFNQPATPSHPTSCLNDSTEKNILAPCVLLLPLLPTSSCVQLLPPPHILHSHLFTLPSQLALNPPNRGGYLNTWSQSVLHAFRT